MCVSAEDVSEVLAALAAAKPALRTISGAEGEPLRMRHAQLREQALGLRANLTAGAPPATVAGSTALPALRKSAEARETPHAKDTPGRENQVADDRAQRDQRGDDKKPVRSTPADPPKEVVPDRRAETPSADRPAQDQAPHESLAPGNHGTLDTSAPRGADPADAMALRAQSRPPEPQPGQNSMPAPEITRQGSGRADRSNGKTKLDAELTASIPFDITDWLSNVTEVAPEDDAQE